MQFNLTSDYAIRIVLYLARNKNRLCSTKEIEKEMAVPSLYIFKVTKKLRKANIIGTMRGSQGGYFLIKEASGINLFDILNLVEPTMQINGCIETGKCSANRIEICQVRKVLCSLNQQIVNELKTIKFSNLIDDGSEKND